MPTTPTPPTAAHPRKSESTRSRPAASGGGVLLGSVSAESLVKGAFEFAREEETRKAPIQPTEGLQAERVFCGSDSSADWAAFSLQR